MILRGNLKVNDADVSSQVFEFEFRGERDEIEIPATFGHRASVRGGDDRYEVRIVYRQGVDPADLSMIFWGALADGDGTIVVSGTLRAGAVSATNPMWTGVALVAGVGLGGVAYTPGEDSQTLRLLDRPGVSVT